MSRTFFIPCFIDYFADVSKMIRCNYSVIFTEDFCLFYILFKVSPLDVFKKLHQLMCEPDSYFSILGYIFPCLRRHQVISICFALLYTQYSMHTQCLQVYFQQSGSCSLSVSPSENSSLYKFKLRIPKLFAIHTYSSL